MLVPLRQVDPSLGRPEHQPDGLHRALGGAPSVTDALRSVDQFRDAVHDAQDAALWTRREARSAAYADIRIDDRVE